MSATPRLIRVPLLVAVALAAGLVATSSPAMATTCPLTLLQFNGLSTSPGFSSAAAAFDTVVAATKELAFDVPAGTLKLRHEGKFTTYVRVIDTFVLGGPPAGTPAALAVQLTIDGAIASVGCGGSNCWGYLRGTLTRGTDVATYLAQENIFSPASRPQHFEVKLPLTMVAGQPETIGIELSAIGAAEFLSSGDASFRFVDLPAGASVTSCRGFAEAATPARPASWGLVKATYR